MQVTNCSSLLTHDPPICKFLLDSLRSDVTFSQSVWTVHKMCFGSFVRNSQGIPPPPPRCRTYLPVNSIERNVASRYVLSKKTLYVVLADSTISDSVQKILLEMWKHLILVLDCMRVNLGKNGLKHGLTEILQNFSEPQILWSLCPVVFHALTMKLPIQISLSVVLKLLNSINVSLLNMWLTKGKKYDARIILYKIINILKMRNFWTTNHGSEDV